MKKNKTKRKAKINKRTYIPFKDKLWDEISKETGN